MGRYDEVRAVLADDETFLSGHGVFFSEHLNQLMRGTILASDGPEHERLRQVVAHRLTPRALREEQASIEAKADALVTALLERDDVLDAVTDIAQAMPMSVVPDCVGVPEDCRHRPIEWAVARLEVGVPPSERGAAAVPMTVELAEYLGALVAERRTIPGSLAHDLLAAADRGEVSMEQCPALMIDYFGPSLETTISQRGDPPGESAAVLHPGHRPGHRDRGMSPADGLTGRRRPGHRGPPWRRPVRCTTESPSRKK
ncbi:hypothetical protein ABZZ74_43460 [Streptomyces sp. NPDC006476]|uniref:hypothetical protein n=1 Tax=Streptomyces sp. NPDC006476 TaxID=3157175 RepID=UPI0033B8F1A3